MRAEPFSLGGMPALRWGRPSRRGILYLHGQGGSKAEAAFFAAAAADAGWQTVSVDLPGHGDRESEAAALVPWQVGRSFADKVKRSLCERCKRRYSS